MAHRPATSVTLRRALFSCVLVLTSSGWFNFREDELTCEEAAAHLENCCPDFDATLLRCDYNAGCGSTEHPSIPIEEATCIRERSCARLIAARVCERAMKAAPIVEDAEGGTTPSARIPVCP
jgi:hypothetical protein